MSTLTATLSPADIAASAAQLTRKALEADDHFTRREYLTEARSVVAGLKDAVERAAFNLRQRSLTGQAGNALHEAVKATCDTDKANWLTVAVYYLDRIAGGK
ncbi:MAG: hypothetical protein P4L84_11295 [Isosphaeraceae bacterium]|nr:hypothetical protein [Isosphaeraceae bacterium]